MSQGPFSAKSVQPRILPRGEVRQALPEPLHVDADLRAAIERIGGVAAASAASVLAQMVRTPVPSPVLTARTLEADDAARLPQLSGAFPVVAHRTVIGDVRGDLLLTQPIEMVRWTGSQLPVLGAADAGWAARRLTDLAGIALAAFALALGRAVDLRIEPEWLRGVSDQSVAGVVARAVERHHVVLALESHAPAGTGIGDFFLLAGARSVETLLAAIDEDR